MKHINLLFARMHLNRNQAPLCFFFLLLLLQMARACQNPLDTVEFLVPIQNFADAYQQTFAMSDGSFVDPTQNQHMRHAFERMLQKTRDVGANYTVTEAGEYNITLCQQDFSRVLLLSVLGNFVTKPVEAQGQAQLSYTGSIGTVVVDRSGDLVIVNSFDSTRLLYLETLLFLSVIAIARLSVMKPVLSPEGTSLVFKFTKPR